MEKFDNVHNIMNSFLVGLLLALSGSAFSASYEGHKVYELTTSTEQENEFLLSLEKDGNFDFWSPINKAGKPVSVMVSPQLQVKFEQSLTREKINFTVPIENVENIIAAEKRYHAGRGKVQGRIGFTEYYRHSEINEYLQEIATDYHDIVSLYNIGTSHYGLPMNLVKISTSGPTSSKPSIFVDAGIHAREWIAPSVALYLINQLVENPANRNLIQDIDWYILPSANPDGYEYTWTSDRLWRKTLTPGTLCDGVDPNRNFGFHWGESGVSLSQCSDIYAGIGAFSTIEASNLRDYLATLRNVRAYLTLHSCGQYLLYPWGYDFIPADNADELQALGVRVNNAIRAVRGTSYTIGNSAIALYPAAGASDDWALYSGIPISYTIELPCGNTGSGFILNPSQILPVSQETFEGFKVFHDYVASQK